MVGKKHKETHTYTRKLEVDKTWPSATHHGEGTQLRPQVDLEQDIASRRVVLDLRAHRAGLKMFQAPAESAHELALAAGPQRAPQQCSLMRQPMRQPVRHVRPEVVQL